MATRVIIYSGKGGTGKTTVSAATAALIASRGKRVLVMSSDPAHSLSDVVGQQISRDHLTLLAPNLYGLEIDTIHEMRKKAGNFEQYVAKTYEGRGLNSGAAAELSSQPGMDEILSLDRLLIEYKSSKWDCIVLDTAPTGNTLRLLAYPEMIIGGEGGKNFFKAYRGVNTMLRPFGKAAQKDEFFQQINQIMTLLNDLSDFVVASDVTIRLVLNPEKLPVMETKRAATFLSLYGVNLDACIINKVLPKNQDLGPYFDYWTELQAKYTLETENSFQPMPVFKSILEEEEPIGVEKLRGVAERLFGEVDPMAKLFDRQLVWVENIEPAPTQGKNRLNPAIQPMHRRLCVYLPFLDEENELYISCEGTDVMITAGRIERSVSLPRILLQSELGNYYYEDNTLKLEFVEKPLVENEIAWEDDPFFRGSELN